MSSPKGEGRNLFRSNSAAGIKYHPVGWPNANVTQLLKQGHMLQNNSAKTLSYLSQFVPMTC